MSAWYGDGHGHACSSCGGYTTCTSTESYSGQSYAMGYIWHPVPVPPDDKPKNLPGGPPRRRVIEGRRPMRRYAAARPRPIRRAVNVGVS